MKVASFTVHGSQAQAIAWKRAAAAEGFRSAGQWLAGAADAYLKARARAGLPVPLAWRRGSFTARLDGGELVPVSGHMSPPFGSFAGTGDGPATYCGRHRHVLVYLPDSRIVATLRSFRQCKALASEMAPTLLRSDAAGIVERQGRESF
jgi:hypothetical protein